MIECTVTGAKRYSADLVEVPHYMHFFLLIFKGCCDSCLDKAIHDNLWVVSEIVSHLYQSLSPQLLQYW